MISCNPPRLEGGPLILRRCIMFATKSASMEPNNLYYVNRSTKKRHFCRDRPIYYVSVHICGTKYWTPPWDGVTAALAASTTTAKITCSIHGWPCCRLQKWADVQLLLLLLLLQQLWGRGRKEEEKCSAKISKVTDPFSWLVFLFFFWTAWHKTSMLLAVVAVTAVHTTPHAVSEWVRRSLRWNGRSLLYLASFFNGVTTAAVMSDIYLPMVANWRIFLNRAHSFRVVVMAERKKGLNWFGAKRYEPFWFLYFGGKRFSDYFLRLVALFCKLGWKEKKKTFFFSH